MTNINQNKEAEKLSYIKRGMVVIVNLPVQKENSIQGGERPCVIVSNNRGNRYSPNVTIIPLTSRSKKDLPTHVVIKSYNNSIALGEQIMTIPKAWIVSLKGRVLPSELKLIDRIIEIAVGIIEEA